MHVIINGIYDDNILTRHMVMTGYRQAIITTDLMKSIPQLSDVFCRYEARPTRLPTGFSHDAKASYFPQHCHIRGTDHRKLNGRARSCQTSWALPLVDAVKKSSPNVMGTPSEKFC